LKTHHRGWREAFEKRPLHKPVLGFLSLANEDHEGAHVEAPSTVAGDHLEELLKNNQVRR